MIKKAIYAGTFDPFTNGHQDILLRSLELFDEVTILIAVSPTKKPLCSMEDRVKMLSEHFADQPKIKVDSWDGLVVEYARKHKIGAMLRGLRPTGDFEIEFQMASMNQKLYPDLETVFLMTRGKHYFISSTLVKEIYNHGGDISEFVPDTIAKYLKKK
ncbi:MAG: pantetheine-phosphate adenylyltransferase [Bdellovibrio sp.]